MKNAEESSCGFSQLPMQELGACLIRLLEQMQEQTEAINRLAASNDLLAQALIQSMDDGEDQPMGYLSGKAR